MSARHRSRGPRPMKPGAERSASEIIAGLRGNVAKPGYREQSLKIHGLICAKCAREFDETTRHMLTVHHKDGNHRNNPVDGSNWENLCIYCHDDEHGRGLLGDYITGGEKR